MNYLTAITGRILKKLLRLVLTKNLFNKPFYNITQVHIRNNLLQGDCIEIGALSSPAELPKATSVEYADIYSAEDAKRSLSELGYLGYHNRKFAEVSIVFDCKRPPLEMVPTESKDSVYSSHSLEHSPNPISALVDYLRVVKKGGVVYTVIPNKKYTYDRYRNPTNIDYLIKKYNNKSWDYTLDEFCDVFLNTDSHEVYFNSMEDDIVDAWRRNDGHHHIYVYDEKNTLELIKFVCAESNSSLIWFDCLNQSDMHFAIRKV